MTDRQLKILQHSLGVDQYGQGPMYRNHFYAGEADQETCRELLFMGYMALHGILGHAARATNYTVTELGKQAMCEASQRVKERSA